MGLDFATLIAQLKLDVPKRGRVPNEGQYELCVKRSVAKYGRDRPMLKTTTIDVVSGTAEYAMPSDFFKLLTVQEFFVEGRTVLVTETGLIPIGDTWTERFEVQGQTLVIQPEPVYDWSEREVRYLSVHVLTTVDSNLVYANLTDADEEIFSQMAQAYALTIIANQMASDATKHTIQGVSENTTDPVKVVREQIEHLTKRYKADMTSDTSYGGAFGHSFEAWELEGLY